MLMRLNQSGLLFVPKRWQRATVVNWLKRIHAWTGFWGALLFLLMGTSGFLLNHRDTLKIDTGKPVEVSAMDVAVGPGAITDAEALGTWGKTALGLTGEAKPPRGGPGGPAGREGRGDRQFMGRPQPEVTKWTRVFTYPDARVTLDYVPGAAFVSAKREANGFLGTIKNLHKGVGLSVVWVLFLDTIAGALVAMALTGFLLWSRLHGSRLLAGGIVAGSLVLAAAGVAPFL